jgi:phenylacetate-CoA ligase
VQRVKKSIRNIITKLKGNSIEKEYQEIKQLRNKNDLLNFQEIYLKKLLNHAYQNVPYYQNIFNKIGIIENNKINLSKFNEIPILTKDLLRKNQRELISKDSMNRKSFQNFSGGSTGEPTMFIQDHTYKKWYIASNKYYYQDMLDIDESNVKKINLWGSPRDLFMGSIGFKSKMINWFTNTLILNSFKMTEIDMKSYIKSINTYKPDLIRGYAGSLYELAKFSEKNCLDIYTPKRLICSAETLTNDMRHKIESTFGTKLYDFYGSRETATLAGECRVGLIHIFSFNNYLEIIDQDNNPVLENQAGRVIVTNLHNYSMPLIRYEIGDMAVLGPKKCSCDNFLPCIKEVSGRLEEQFVKRDGSIVIGYFFVHLLGVVLNKGYIKKFQVIQEDYEKIRILAVLDKGLPESEKNEIEQKIRVNMGTNCQILWDFVETIPKAPSGKYLYTKSLVYHKKDS